MKPILLFLCALMAGEPPIKILTADLKPETIAGFDRYIQAAEARISIEESHPGSFLYFDSLPTSGQNQIKASLRQGAVFIKELATLDSAGHLILAPGGLIHHWLGLVFIPGVSLNQVMSLVQDYSQQQNYYRPWVVRSRLISHQGNEFKIYLRLQEMKIITVTLDTDHAVAYYRLDATRMFSRSYSTRIQEVRDAGEPGEYLLPVGHDGGLLKATEAFTYSLNRFL